MHLCFVLFSHFAITGDCHRLRVPHSISPDRVALISYA